MRKTWILVAGQSAARIFTVDTPRGDLEELETLVHPEARMHASKFASDEPGRGYDRRGKASHSVSTSVEPKEQEAIRFAKTIADHIARAVTDNAIGRLYLVASDHSLGLLRKHIGSLHNVETIEVNKNLEHMDARDIRTHLPERL